MTFDATRLGVAANLSHQAGLNVSGETFSVSKKAVFAFWGILPVARPELENALAGQLVDGSEIIDLRVRVRSRFVDLLITGLTAGLIVPRSVTYEGVIVVPGQD